MDDVVYAYQSEGLLGLECKKESAAAYPFLRERGVKKEKVQ